MEETKKSNERETYDFRDLQNNEIQYQQADKLINDKCSNYSIFIKSKQEDRVQNIHLLG